MLLPLPKLPSRVDEIDPPDSALVVVYCHHGVRNISGAALLSAFGAVSLTDGIDACWFGSSLSFANSAAPLAATRAACASRSRLDH